jgi:hypothetical protein
VYEPRVSDDPRRGTSDWRTHEGDGHIVAATDPRWFRPGPRYVYLDMDKFIAALREKTECVVRREN